MADELGSRRTRHAVVVGGSLAGLLAARVLSEHAERVTVVERDRYPQEPEGRPGVPQSRHLHVLIEGGQRAFDELLPGFVAELHGLGAPKLGVPEDMVQWQDGRWYPRTEPTVHFYAGPRDQLDWLVRKRVFADPRIERIEGTEAVGLLGDSARVRGVLLRERGAGASKEPYPLEADLVVDASGRSTRAADWLAGIGAEAPHEETIDTGLAYSTRIFRSPAADPSTDAVGYYIVPNPAQVYSGVILPLGDGRHVVTLAGLRGDEPPTDEKLFEEFARRLPHPVVADWIAKAEPLTPVFGFRKTANIRRRYDRPGRRPAGFLATGDALCAFNPIYGQGMAIAAMTALALRTALADTRRTPTTRRVQKALLDASRQAWDISAGADKKMPGATGDAARTGTLDKVTGWYLARVAARAAAHPVVGPAFRSALHLTAPLTAVFAPAVVRAALFDPVPETPAEPPMWRQDA
ncbi:NAD(P)/FAD-dependent oxidoreductase [Streptomyces sp. NPDC012637]|uniref:NAD(P)/FAD-dependent oxidoreductase n=1 Tax=Streptomyces sp. NPDC012637 TaxID=3364842 RepID=UPI0036E9804A